MQNINDLNKVKILLIGPTQARKSSISNFIAERPDVLKPNYHATVACRIIEFEKEAPSILRDQDKIKF